MKQGDKPDLKALTGLRFFAAISVVIYHFARPALAGSAEPLLRLAGSGYAAVSFFFLLSGFILSYSYLDRQGTFRGTRKDFYVARFARIYPAYLLAFFLAAPFNILASLHANHWPVAGAKLLVNAVSYLSLQQAWTPWTAWAWNFPAWSVSVEAFFYLTFPFIAPRLARLKLSSCLQLCGVLWLACLLIPTVLVVGKGITAEPQLNDYLQMFVEFNPLLRLPEFLIGIVLGRVFTLGFTDRLPRQGLAYAAMVAVVGVLALVPEIPHPLLANGLMVPLFAWLILSLTKDRSWLQRLLSIPAIVLLGEASYGIYILQIPVSQVLHLPPPSPTLTLFVIYMAALIVAALLSWKFVELPLRNLIRTRLTSKGAISSPAPSLTGDAPAIGSQPQAAGVQ